jgi:hypothetical protein
MRIINKRNGTLFGLILLVSVGFIYREELMMIARHSVRTWSASNKISRALDNAKSVVLVEYDDTGDKARVTAGPTEVAELRRATTRWLLPSVPEGFMCFESHHRVEVVRTDGSQFRLVICFGCRNFELDPPQTDIIGVPDPWRKSLIALFKSQGMNPWNSDEHL